jgi:exodeoxyribonuclease-3
MMSPEASDRLRSADIEKHVRGWEKPSDHVPVIAHLDLVPVVL